MKPIRPSSYLRSAADQEDTRSLAGNEILPGTQYDQDRTDGRKPNKIFEQLIEQGRKQLDEQESADFFAKFGQQASRGSRSAAAHYRIGLGLLGTGDKETARQEFEQAVKLNQSHPWARYQRDALSQETE